MTDNAKKRDNEDETEEPTRAGSSARAESGGVAVNVGKDVDGGIHIPLVEKLVSYRYLQKFLRTTELG